MLAAIEDLGKVEDALTPEGFFTQEIRDEGKRVGFDVVTVGANPRRGPLARRIEDAGASPRPRHRVGRYAVDVASLEALACPALSGDTLNPKKPARKRFVALDEIGAMECLSDRFEHAAWLALESPTNVVLGSMCVRANDKNGKKHAFANAVAARPDVAVVVVETETRDALRLALVDALRGAVGAYDARQSVIENRKGSGFGSDRAARAVLGAGAEAQARAGGGGGGGGGGGD